VRGMTAYYPTGDFTPTAYQSVHQFQTTQAECQAITNMVYFKPPDECCYSYNPAVTAPLSPAVAFDLSTLGLVPPFHVEGP